MEGLSKTLSFAWQKAVNKFLLGEEAAKYMAWGDLTPTQILDLLTAHLRDAVKDNTPNPISKALELGQVSLTNQTAEAFDKVEGRWQSLPLDKQLMVSELFINMGSAQPEHAVLIGLLVRRAFLGYLSTGTAPHKVRAHIEHAVQARYEFILKDLTFVNDQFKEPSNVVPLNADSQPNYNQQKLTTWLMSWMAEMDRDQRTETIKVILQYVSRGGEQSTNDNLTTELRHIIHTHHSKVNLLAPCMKTFVQMSMVRLTAMLRRFFKEPRDELSQDPPLTTLFASACSDEVVANIAEWREVCVVNGQLIDAEAHSTRDVLLQALEMSQDDFNLVLQNLREQVETASPIEDFEPVMREVMLEALSLPVTTNTVTCIHFLVARLKEKLQTQENAVETPDTQAPESTELTVQMLCEQYHMPPTLLQATAGLVTNSPLNQRVGWESQDVLRQFTELYLKEFQSYLESLESMDEDSRAHISFTDGIHMQKADKCAEHLLKVLRQEWFHAWKIGKFNNPTLHEILVAGEVKPLLFAELIAQYKQTENGNRLFNAHGQEAFNEMVEQEMVNGLLTGAYSGERLVRFATNRLDIRATNQSSAASIVFNQSQRMDNHLTKLGGSLNAMHLQVERFCQQHGDLTARTVFMITKGVRAAIFAYDEVPDQMTFEELVDNLLEQLLKELVPEEEPRQLRSSADLQGEPRGVEPLIPQHDHTLNGAAMFGLVGHPSVDDLVDEMLKETEEITIEAIMYQLPKQVQVGDILKATNGALRFKQIDTVKIIRKIVKACAERLVAEQ